MASGVLVALTLPGQVVLLVVVAALEHAWSRAGRRSPLLHRRRHALSAGGLDVFYAALVPGRDVDLDSGVAPCKSTGKERSSRPATTFVATSTTPIELGGQPVPVPGLAAGAGHQHEGRRHVLHDAESSVPGKRNPQDTFLSRSAPTVGTDRYRRGQP